MNGKNKLASVQGGPPPNHQQRLMPRPNAAALQLAMVSGQEPAKRALLIVVAGGHNILLSGPPGNGKTMLARALPGLLPPMDHEERLEVTQLQSLGNLDYSRPVKQRPFRAPHHSSSLGTLIGSGKNPHPGEISLAHRGVLMLDELPEFNRTTVDALRQPLEDRHITLGQSPRSVTLPADCIVVATANPCPCGYFGTDTPAHRCKCPAAALARYKSRLSGPIIDRFDLHCYVGSVGRDELLDAPPSAAVVHLTTKLLERISRARQIQSLRFGSSMVNAQMPTSDVRKYCQVAAKAKSLLDQAADRLGLSARGYLRTLRVARTIADLEATNLISSQHITEALYYRQTS